MWLGNSSSPPRLIPWSSVNKSPGGGHGKQPKPRLGVSPEDLAKPLRNSSEHTQTPLAALRSHSRQPHSKKPGGTRKKKKGGGLHGPRKKKNGKKKFRKGARNPHGGRGRSKHKGRKKAGGAKKPPRGKKQTTSSSQTKKKSTRRRDSSASPEGSPPTKTTRARQHHHPHSPGGGQRSQSGKPATKPGDVERDKTGASFKKTSITWTSTSLKREGTRATGSLKPESSTSGASVRLAKAATLKPKDGKEHSTLSTRGTGPPSGRRHHSTTKSKELLGDHGSRKSAEQGRPPATPHRGMLPKTQSSSPDKTAATNSAADKLGRKQGIEQAAGHSSQGTTKEPSAVTPSSKAGSSKPNVAASQAPAQMRGGKNSNGNASKPAEPSGTSSAGGSTQSSKTSAAKTGLSSSPAGKTGSGLTKRPRDSKFGASAAAAIVSKARPPESRESRQVTRRHSLQTTSQGSGKQGVTTQDAPPHKKKQQELHGRHHQRHNHPGSTRQPTRSPDVTSLLTALRRLEQATKASERATANKAAQTKRPEAKDAQKLSTSPQAARLANSASLSSLLPTIRVKAPEASTSKSKR